MLPSEHLWNGVGKGTVMLHHAYGITGNRDEILPDLFLFLKKVFEFEVARNPDCTVRQFDVLTIDDARRIAEIQSRKAFTARKVIIVSFNTATREAQNSLLKILEEPSADTIFFLIVPSTSVLLPTVLSRLFLVESDPSPRAEVVSAARDFLYSSYATRMEFVKSLAESLADEKSDRQFVVDFLGQLEVLLSNIRKQHQIPPSVFEDIALCQKYIGDRSASVKMLLEHCALVLPALGR